VLKCVCSTSEGALLRYSYNPHVVKKVRGTGRRVLAYIGHKKWEKGKRFTLIDIVVGLANFSDTTEVNAALVRMCLGQLVRLDLLRCLSDKTDIFELNEFGARAASDVLDRAISGETDFAMAVPPSLRRESCTPSTTITTRSPLTIVAEIGARWRPT
jgi:hypothetical protein